MIRLGGPVFMDSGRGAGKSESHGSAHPDVYAIARKHKEKGYGAAYAPQVEIHDTDRLRDIRKAFESEGVLLAEVQYWDNLLHPDRQQALFHRDKVKEALAIAEEIGARCAINTVGSFRTESLNHHSPRNFTREAFDAAVEIARDIIDSVKPKRSFFVYEVLAMHIIDSPKVLADMLKAVDRPQFGAHMDLTNLINCPRAYWNGGADMIREAVDLFGDRIVGAHAKDITLEDGCDTVRMNEIRPGLGCLDYTTYLRLLGNLGRDIPLMMEHLPTDAEYDLAANYIRSKAAEAGVAIT